MQMAAGRQSQATSDWNGNFRPLVIRLVHIVSPADQAAPRGKLQPWQIYKALHSAIQQRGYDPDVPWKKAPGRLRRRGREENEEEKSLRERAEQFTQTLERMSPGKPQFHFRCYFDAWKMGLWNPKRPKALKARISCVAESTRDQVMPRELVKKEIRALMNAAARQIPALKNKANYFLYGPAGKPCASLYPALRKKHRLHEGGMNDWHGARPKGSAF